MTRNTTLMTICLSGLSLGIAACGGSSTSGGGESSSGGEASYEGPIASTDAAGGQAVYETYCTSCHTGAADARGPALNDRHCSAASIRQRTREGGEHMPAFPESRISATDMESLLAYMVTLNAADSVGGADAMQADAD